MIKFTKMNGLGNDFVIIDYRENKIEISPQKAGWLAYRRYGIGCDQVILLDDSANAEVFMNIYNSDGSQVNACGNAARCVAYLLMQKTGKNKATIETKAGILTAKRSGEDSITVNMGEPSFDWREIPLAEETDVLQLPIKIGPLERPAAVSMGNPHMVFFMENIDDVDLRSYGKALENHELFPERCNVSIAEFTEDDDIRMKVWERGAGKTLACGTAACAAAVLAITGEFIDGPKVNVELPGGKLEIEWHEDGHVLMTGPVSTNFVGAFDEAAIFHSNGK